MTVFLFETMTAEQAASFTGADQLVFTTASSTAYNVAVANSGGLNLVTLTDINGVARTFAAGQLKTASEAGRLSFSDGSNVTLVVGTSGDDTSALAGVQQGVFHGFAGDDVITTNNGASTVFGGAGDDTITGGNGNDHLYGFGITGDPSTDGDDSIFGGAGNDYIQGNAGDDTLDGGTGNDRIQGGQGDDLIFGDAGNDVINGNKGDDTISGGTGDDVIRGGQGDDVIGGDAGNDILLGDLGNDTITGGTGIDVMTGGAGADRFVFAAGDAAYATTGALAYFADQITDFTLGEDKISLGTGIGVGASNILHAQDGITLTSVEAAITYAQQLITVSGSIDAVAALQIGSDTYLFYDDNGGLSASINAMVKLDGVTAADFTTASIGV